MNRRQQLEVAYRLATNNQPMRQFASPVAGRFHRADQGEPTQYACLHPLGPWAEFARAMQMRDDAMLSFVQERVWALRIDIEPLVRITFENAAAHGIEPAELVSANRASCQSLADRLRAEGARGIIVPSAALPGTENVVLFGARELSPYSFDPLELIDVSAAITADRAAPPKALTNAVRHTRARTHEGLRAFERGDHLVFNDLRMQ